MTAQLSPSPSHVTLEAALIQRLQRAVTEQRIPAPLQSSDGVPIWFAIDTGDDQAEILVRAALPTDLEGLAALDSVCWPAPLRSPPERLLSRIQNAPDDQIVVLRGERIIGAIYGQRITGAQALRSLPAHQFETLHAPDGMVAQLLGVCVDPAHAQTGIGEALVQLALRLARAAGITTIVGVTLCRDFSASGENDVAAYVARSDASGLPVDAILRFHVARGARILDVLPGAFPGYMAGAEAGVLIAYDAGRLDAITGDSAVKLDINARDVPEIVAATLRDVLGPSRAAGFAPGRTLHAMGLDSLDLHSLRAGLNRALGTSIDATFFFRHPTPEKIVEGLIAPPSSSPKPKAAPHRTAATSTVPHGQTTSTPVAIIGMACRFPGNVTTPDEFWALLSEGRDGITDVPASRWNADALYDPAGGPGRITTRRGGFVADVDQFDPGFFGLSPREAAAMDPQQRLLLECSWEALERAGIDPAGLAGSDTQVVVGLFGHDYERIAGGAGRLDGHYGTGNSGSIASGRIAYTLGLQGAALSVDTACSAGLVAVHLAAKALRAGDCRMALAGAVNLILSPELSIAFSQAGMLAPDGHCKPFSAEANGYVRSEGCAVIALKRLDDALADGDPVLAVIEGSAVNNDGPSNGLTAPNGLAQQAVIRRALDDAGVAAGDIDYVEAHGTGTPLGDPIEFNALAAVHGGRAQPLLIGSVKSNIGHTEAAAGLAGLMKTVLALRNSAIPPQLHLGAINPLLDLAAIPARLPTQLQPWERRDGQRRRAGISSFGFSGTNAHVVLAEAPDLDERPDDPRQQHLLVLSARSPAALRALGQRYLDYFATSGDTQAPDDIAATAATGRSAQPHRLAIVGAGPAAWRRELSSHLAGGPYADVISGTATTPPVVAFLFTGQGSQYPGMAEELARSHPGFAAALNECAELFAPFLDRPLLEIMNPAAGQPVVIEQMSYAQPALFSFQYALARLWIDAGITPSVVMGHSLGEVTAACIAGVLDLPEAVELVAMRGRLMQATPDGAMAVVFADAAFVERRIAGRTIVIAAYNSPQNCVISGAPDAVDAALADFAREGIEVHRLHVSRAGHSPLMESMLAPFGETCRKLHPRPPRIRVVSNVTGELIDDELTDPFYWVRHVRQPVRFRQGIATAAALGANVFLEIGPRPVLTGVARDCLTDSTVALLPSLVPTEPAWQTLSRAAGDLFVRGAGINWRTLECRPSRRIALPTTPFERKRYWIDAAPAADSQPALRLDAPAAAPSSLIGPMIPLALDGTVHATTLGGGRWPALETHRLGETPTLSAAAMLAMMIEAHGSGPGGACPISLAPLRLSSIAFRQPLPLPDHAVDVQTLLLPHEPGTRRARIASRGADASWTVHAEAELSDLVAERDDAAITEPNALQHALTAGMTIDQLIARLRAEGCEPGVGMTCLTSLRGGPGEAIGHIGSGDVPSALANAIRLDGALLVAQAALPETIPCGIPAGCERIDLLGDIAGLAWSHAKLRNVAPGGRAAVLDLMCYAADGATIARISGMTFVRAAAAPRPEARTIHVIDWIDAPHRKLPLRAAASTARPWLLLADQGEQAQSLAALLGSRGIVSHIVADDADGISQLDEGIDAVVDLRALSTSSDASTAPTERLATLAPRVLASLQQLTQLAHPPRRLFALSRGAMATLADEPTDAAIAALQGLPLVLGREQTWLGARLIDIDTSALRDAAFADWLIADFFDSASAEWRMAWRDGSARVPRLRLSQATAPKRPHQFAGKTQLIAGGGALGAALARWLAAHGATHIVIASRSAETAARALADELRGRNVTVMLRSTDLGQRSDVAALLDGCRGVMPPLGGVFHTAGSHDDGLIETQTWDRVKDVLAAKLDGAWHLHEATRHLPLDHFVLFSSAFGLFGAPGLAGYVAANAGLDALAHVRRAAGLPALSINWGPWSGAGMVGAGERATQREWTRQGLREMPAEACLAVLGQLIRTDLPQAAVLDADWTLFTRACASTPPALIDALVAPKATTAAGAMPLRVVRSEPATDNQLRSELARLPARRRRAALADHLAGLVAAVLGFAGAADIDRTRGFFALGMDSLATLDLRNRIRASLGHRIEQTTLFRHGSVEQLATFLDAALFEQPSGRTGARA
ncbi:SDR family NAD(P)-dependent oxidoreductase [Bradyrhizobium sp. HKCCYLS3077]|uniref:SDR family NAD(P)-dependent oxidoreductase n=1 Tax=Bradyrhizobium sp. HKCCYLS3077 TaxID=3420761 RepID=UPI003EB99735